MLNIVNKIDSSNFASSQENPHHSTLISTIPLVEEANTHYNEVIATPSADPTSNPSSKEDTLVCSPTLELSPSQGSSPNVSTHSEAQSMPKALVIDLSLDDVPTFQSVPISSTMSEQNFDGDPPYGRAT